MRGLGALFGALVCAVMAGGAMAQSAPSGARVAAESPADIARAAAARLEAASVALHQATSAKDRVKALTQTVQAYETGLEALRVGLRRAAIRERQLEADLSSREDDIGQLLAVLQTIGQAPGPMMLLHPEGATGTARLGMIISDVTPGVDARAAELRKDLEELSVLRSLQESAADTLQSGLSGAQDARTALSQAIADRVDLPRRFDQDDIKVALLLASTETLEGFASALVDLHEVPSAAEDLAARKGSLELPVTARILRRAGEADAAGIRRPGLVLATRNEAIVVAPTAATIRFRGALLDYGTVVILEPRAGVLFVFAGMQKVFGDPGQVVAEGAPLGLMGAKNGANASPSGDGAGNTRPETLYIEVRENNTPVDPETWFATNKDK